MPQSEPRRVVFIDVLRLIAAFQMIQGHTLDALLASELRRGPWFAAWTFARGLTSTVCFPMGNLAPEGSVIKSTAIDPSLIGEDNVYRHRGPARVFLTEEDAIAAIKNGSIGRGDVIVLICGGPKGAGMQETYQVTSALKALPHCKHVAVLTDARFSGVTISYPLIGAYGNALAALTVPYISAISFETKPIDEVRMHVQKAAEAISATLSRRVAGAGEPG